MNAFPRRVATAAALTSAAVLLTAGPALAHVTVDPRTAPGGGYATVNFKVPNERDNASTVKLEVTLPTDHPLASVMPEPVPGWKATVEEGKLDKPIEMHGEKIDEAPRKITWTADGDGISPGTFQRFPVSVGRLPEDADQLVFKAVQTYDSDEVVRWIEVPEEGGEEPDSPAPVLKLTEPEGDHHHSTEPSDTDDAKGTDDTEPAAETSAADDGDDGTDTTARVLAVVGIVAGLGGIAFGAYAGRRRSA